MHAPYGAIRTNHTGRGGMKHTQETRTQRMIHVHEIARRTDTHFKLLVDIPHVIYKRLVIARKNEEMK